MCSESEPSSEVLVVEDEQNLRELMTDLLSARGITVSAFDTIDGAAAYLETHAPDVLVLDLKLPDGDGLELLEQARSAGIGSPAVIITAFGTVERAAAAMRAGASDFLVKPFDNDRFGGAVAAAIAKARQLEEVELQAGVVGEGSELSRELIGSSGGLKDVVALLRRVASLDATVLINGESGTGKELIARGIHESSPRLDGPFMSIDCSSIPPTLLESELFGFERGAFTGAHARRRGRVELADGGTLFLDEIGDMPIEAQSRLLRVLQEREITRIGGREPVKVDVRIIAATHRNLEQLASEQKFRSDLLYRLNVVPILLPPLRERRQDIPGLIEHFLTKHSARHELTPPALDNDMLAKMSAYPWPGNVRELQNFVERAVVLGFFDVDALKTKKEQPTPETRVVEEQDVREGPPAEVKTMKQAVAKAERAAVVAALQHAEGNKAQAARLLGVSYKTLFNKIHEYDIKEAVRIH